jgi:LPXTG-motif cell wall-anchored protein
VATLRVPASVVPGAHTLQALGADSGITAEAALTVLAADAAAPGAAGSGPGALSTTGVSVVGFLSLAGLFLAAGAWLVVRRRRIAS